MNCDPVRNLVLVQVKKEDWHRLTNEKGKTAGKVRLSVDVEHLHASDAVERPVSTVIFTCTLFDIGGNCRRRFKILNYTEIRLPSSYMKSYYFQLLHTLLKSSK